MAEPKQQYCLYFAFGGLATGGFLIWLFLFAKFVPANDVAIFFPTVNTTTDEPSTAFRSSFRQFKLPMLCGVSKNKEFIQVRPSIDGTLNIYSKYQNVSLKNIDEILLSEGTSYSFEGPKKLVIQDEEEEGEVIALSSDSCQDS
jgi:hypothetical protein